MVRRRLTWLLPVLVALLVTGCRQVEAPVEAQGVYSTARVTRGDMADVVQAFGQVAAIDARFLAFDTVSGRAIEVLVQPGQQVAAGDELVRLDTSDLERQLREARAELVVAEAVLAEAQEDASPAEILKAEAELEAARHELAKAEMELALAQSRGVRALQAEVADKAHALQKARDQFAVVELTSQAAQIRKLEYDVAFLQRALRDIQPDQDRSELEAGLADTERALAGAVAARESAIRAARDEVAKAQDELSRAQARLQQATSGGGDPAAEARLARERANQRVVEATEQLEQAREGPDPARLETAETTHAAAAAKVESLVAAIEASTLVAPFAGVVFDVYVAPGQHVPSGERVVYLADPDQLRIEAYVSEVDVVRLHPGQVVRTRFEPYPTRLVEGEILTVSPRGEPMGGLMGFKVEVSVDKGDLDLRPGMTALLRVVVGERTGVLLVPSAALRQGITGNMVVDVERAEGTWEQREVEIGLNDGVVTEVLQGLAEGDVVRMPLQEPSPQDPYGQRMIVPEAPPPPAGEVPVEPPPGDEAPPGEEPPAEQRPQGPDAEPLPPGPGERGAEDLAPDQEGRPQRPDAAPGVPGASPAGPQGVAPIEAAPLDGSGAGRVPAGDVPAVPGEPELPVEPTPRPEVDER